MSELNAIIGVGINKNYFGILNILRAICVRVTQFHPPSILSLYFEVISNTPPFPDFLLARTELLLETEV